MVLVSVLGAAQVHLSWPCELGASSWPCRQCSRWRASCGFGCRSGSPAIMQLLFQQSMSYVFCASVQFLDRVSDIAVGYLVGDAQCTLCTGPWSSTGPGSWCGVERLLLCNNRCRGRLCWRMLGSTVGTFCVFTWCIMEEFYIFSS